MRCLSKTCNVRLSDFEATRRWISGGYVDKCVFCEPANRKTQTWSTANASRTVRRTHEYNANYGDDPPIPMKESLDFVGEPWYFDPLPDEDSE